MGKASLDQLPSRMVLAWVNHRYTPATLVTTPQWTLTTWTWTSAIDKTLSERCSKTWAETSSSCSRTKKKSLRVRVSAMTSSISYLRWKRARRLTATFASRRSDQTETKAVCYLAGMRSTKAAWACGWRTTIAAPAAGPSLTRIDQKSKTHEMTDNCQARCPSDLILSRVSSDQTPNLVKSTHMKLI